MTNGLVTLQKQNNNKHSKHCVNIRTLVNGVTQGKLKQVNIE